MDCPEDSRSGHKSESGVSAFLLALGVAQPWRERFGLPRDKKWNDIIAGLSPLPVADSKCVALESHPDTWKNIKSRYDHPEMLMSLGFLPGGPDVGTWTVLAEGLRPLP